MPRARLRSPLFPLLLLCGASFLSFAAAQEGTDPKTPPAKLFQLPPVLEKNLAPASVDELRAVEAHVQKVIEKVMPAVVGIRIGNGQGSGVIVKEDGTALTAGHVSGPPNQNAQVVMPSGKVLKGKALGRFVSIDSGMVKIVDEGKYPFVEMGKSADLRPGQWVVAIGHPGGFRPNRTPVVRLGRILFANQFVIRTDCTLVGGDSGGPLFDMQGRVIGIHSRIGGFAITENMHVPVDTFRETWDKLVKGDSWGSQLGQMPTVMSLGGKIVFEKKDKLTKDDPLMPSPKDKAELAHHKLYGFAMKAGHSYTFDLVSDDKTGKKLDTFLRLESADGKELAQDDDGGGFPNSRIVHHALKNGDYRVIATSFEPKQTGSYTLTIREADFHTGQVDVLRAAKIPLPAVAKVMQELAKSKGQPHLNAVLVDDRGAPVAGKEITVKWDGGQASFKSDSEGVVRWPLKKEQTKKMSFALPDGLRAALVLTDQDGKNVLLGKGDLSMESVRSAGGPIVKTIDGVLKTTDPYDLERAKCYRHIHELKLAAGKAYTLDLVSEDFDAFLRLEHDEKGNVAEDDDGGGNLNARIVLTPKEEGTYRLVATTSGPGQVGVSPAQPSGKSTPRRCRRRPERTRRSNTIRDDERNDKYRSPLPQRDRISQPRASVAPPWVTANIGFFYPEGVASLWRGRLMPPRQGGKPQNLTPTDPGRRYACPGL